MREGQGIRIENPAGRCGLYIAGHRATFSSLTGVPVVLAAEERVASIIADSIQPRLVFDIDIVPWRKT